MTRQILKAIHLATGEKCGTVAFDRSANDWRITGVFASDIPAIMRELAAIGLRRKQSSSGFFVCK